MIEVNHQETPLCIINHNEIPMKSRFFSSWKGLSDFALEMSKKTTEKPQNSMVKQVLALCEKERLEGGSDFKETDGSNAGKQVKKYLSYVGLPEGNPWCASFVCYILGQFGIDNPKSGDTWELEKWAMSKKIYYSENPQPGDVFLKLDGEGKPEHTGFVKEIDPTDKRYLLTIEGNASDSIKHCNDKLVSNCKYIRWTELK